MKLSLFVVLPALPSILALPLPESTVAGLEKRDSLGDAINKPNQILKALEAFALAKRDAQPIQEISKRLAMPEADSNELGPLERLTDEELARIQDF